VANARYRQTELDDMLLECRQFDRLHAEFDRWLVSVEQELATDTPANINTQRLNKQNKVIEADIVHVQLLYTGKIFLNQTRSISESSLYAKMVLGLKSTHSFINQPF